ncbi:unnamed protein product, partial [Rotaria socialis]
NIKSCISNQKTLKNEELRTRYPLFQSSSSITVIHQHYKSTVNIIDELIVKAKQAARYMC